MDFLNQFPPQLKSIATVLIVGAVLFFILKLVLGFTTKRLKVWAEKTETKVDDFILVWISKTTSIFLILLSFYIAFHSIGATWEEKVEKIMWYMFLFGIIIQCAIWGKHLIDELINQLNQRHNHGVTKNPIYNVVSFMLYVLLFVTLLLVFLGNIGVNVQALIAGLGVGGIAIALALQNILGDLFASVTIALDKPFEVGDYVVFETFMGHIEKIGIKTTRIRSVTGEEIIISNSDLLKNKIRNFQRLFRRRVAFEFGVSYDTKNELLKEIPILCKKLVQEMEQCTFERCHFRNLGQFSLNFEIVYWVENKEHVVQLDRTQELLLGMKKIFEERGIEFAYPTQTLIMKSNETN